MKIIRNFKEAAKSEHMYSSRTEMISTPNIESVKDGLRRKILAETEENSEAEDALKKIDFADLRAIVADRMREICPELAEDDINILTPDSIKFKKQFGTAFISGQPALYEPLSNLMTIEYHQLKKIYADAADKALLYACFHEEIHAVSRNVCDYGTYESRVIQNGYRYIRGYDDCALSAFDEVVTEKMTREIVAEYEKIKGTPILRGLKLAYEKVMPFLDLLIERIAVKTGVEESVIWKKIQREKIIGKEEGVESVMDRLKQLFSEDFVDKLSDNDLVKAKTELENF